MSDALIGDIRNTWIMGFHPQESQVFLWWAVDRWASMTKSQEVLGTRELLTRAYAFLFRLGWLASETELTMTIAGFSDFVDWSLASFAFRFREVGK